MPIIGNKLCRISVDGIQIINALHKYFAENKKIKTILEIYEDNADIYDLECFKLFGTINDVNEILDMECKYFCMKLPLCYKKPVLKAQCYVNLRLR